jgi:hypothetical protein
MDFEPNMQVIVPANNIFLDFFRNIYIIIIYDERGSVGAVVRKVEK